MTWESRMSERVAGRRAAAWAQAEAMNAVYNDPPEPSEAEIRSNIPARQDAQHCGHGLPIGGEPTEEWIATTWGPEDYSTCLCCEDSYLCVGSGYFAGGGADGDSSVYSTTDQYLCEGCGGQRRREVHGIPGETQISTGFGQCVDAGEHIRVPGNKTSQDPRITYRDVTVCAECGIELSWTTVWFAELQDHDTPRPTYRS